MIKPTVQPWKATPTTARHSCPRLHLPEDQDEVDGNTVPHLLLLTSHLSQERAVPLAFKCCQVICYAKFRTIPIICDYREPDLSL